MKYLSLAMVIVFCLVAGGCTKLPAETTLFDFETDVELDRLHWQCHTLVALSDQHATHGSKSLKLELYPSEYPGLTPVIRETNWNQYALLSFDVYNPQDKAISLMVRIDDRKDYPYYSDRYNKSITIKPGANAIRIPIESLVTSGTNRSLNLKKIARLAIFMVKPNEKTVLYFDNVRLMR